MIFSASSRPPQEDLFPGFQSAAPARAGRALSYPLWTHNKARLVQEYLRSFLQITRHGTYIDAFSGPQDPDHPEAWAARLALELQPKWLRHFHLFESSPRSLVLLELLKNNQPPVPGRTVTIWPGDFNVRLHELLRRGSIKQTEAVFCLLDQRTFECHWSSVQALARYKAPGHKVELLYLFPEGWLPRSIKATTVNTEVLRLWWGSDEWERLIGMKRPARVATVVARFREQLGYQWVVPWPIYERDEGRRLMYYMIQASDHQEAPILMGRAYETAVRPLPPPQEVLFSELQDVSASPTSRGSRHPRRLRRPSR